MTLTKNYHIFSEIGLAKDNSAVVPPKNIFGNETGDFVLRGNCYHDCFKDADAEINLHSIIEFGSKNVEKMKILKLTNGKMHKPCENCKRSRFDIHLTPINFFGFFVQNSQILDGMNFDPVNYVKET